MKYMPVPRTSNSSLWVPAPSSDTKFPQGSTLRTDPPFPLDMLIHSLSLAQGQPWRAGESWRSAKGAYRPWDLTACLVVKALSTVFGKWEWG